MQVVLRIYTIARGDSMARQVRKRSSTGIYHVMIRGINYRTIFGGEEDFKRHLKTLKDYEEKLNYTIYAYCLMGNHIHLLIKEGSEELGKIFQTIGASFVCWYNLKYGRRGHLFQGRYKSEVVESDRCFLSVTRYIHQNPAKAGIIKNIEDYKWSSYREYIGEPEICNTDYRLNIFSSNIKKAIELFKEYNSGKNEDKYLDIEEKRRLNDSEAREIILKIAEIKNPSQVMDFNKERRGEIIKAFRQSGLSIRQISRLTGVSQGIVRRISID